MAPRHWRWRPGAHIQHVTDDASRVHYDTPASAACDRHLKKHWITSPAAIRKPKSASAGSATTRSTAGEVRWRLVVPRSTGWDDDAVDDLVTIATGLIAGHPAVTSVKFAGSRSRGTHEQLSDWDFAVETSDFEALAQDLPALVAPLDPLGQQWEPMGHFPVYQVLLRGPTKIEYLFLDRSQDPLPPLEPSGDTLPAINTHFWDWIWWLTTKASIGRSDLVAEHMPKLYTQLLRPMGISAVPATIESAVEAFVARRNALEQKFGISVDRALETEVRQGIARVLAPR
jgi:hypothetical protein